MDWRVLVVDDEVAQDAVDIIAGHKVMPAPDSIICETCDNFSSALIMLEKERFDLVILDLKGGESDDEHTYAGEKVYTQLKSLRFIPVVFYSGFAQKIKNLESPFVKVVVKGDDPQDLRSAVKAVFSTKLPKLVRHIEEEQRRFMWESADKIFVDDFDKKNSVDLVYLLARRLGNLLSSDVIKNYLVADESDGAPQSDKVHAIEFYIWPPLSKHFLFGDIFVRKNGDKNEYVVALTPSCDHVQGNAEFILLAKCKYLKDTAPGDSIKKSLSSGAPLSKTSTEKLYKFIRDNSSPADRYKYLPGTSFIPDLIVDLQDTVTIPPQELTDNIKGYERLASLDSPFAEALQAKMTRYFARVGTPDIDADLAFSRFQRES